MTTKTILTPDRVAQFRRWADMKALVSAYALRGALAETLDSNEALRQQLDEAQEKLRNLEELDAIEIDVRADVARAKEKRLIEEEA